MENLRLDPERAERCHPANSEHHFLAHAHFEIAAVKLGCDPAIVRVVLRDVGVEQIEIDATDAQPPELRPDFAIEKLNRDEQLLVAAPHFRDRQVMKILVQADGVLDAVLVDLLFEIAVPVKQSDRDEIQIEIAGGFAMVAGQNAKPAGIIRDRFMKAELGGKISDRFCDGAARAGFAVGVLPRQILAKVVVHFL